MMQAWQSHRQRSPTSRREAIRRCSDASGVCAWSSSPPPPRRSAFPQAQLPRSQAAGSLAGLAARQNVSLARVRSIALGAADPVLDEAMRAGVITDAERRALRWRIRERGQV